MTDTKAAPPRLEMTMKDWILNKALAAHMRDPWRFYRGPAHSSLWGWFYFRVLCGMWGSIP